MKRNYVLIPIGGNGKKIELSPLTVTENGVYTAEEDKGYSEVSVNVPKTDVSVVSKVDRVKDLGYTNLQANIYVASNKTISSCGVEVSETSDFAEVVSYTSANNSNGTKNIHITGLTPNTTYYIRSFVVVNGNNYNQEPFNTSTTIATPAVPENILANATKMVTANTDVVNLKFKDKSPNEIVYIDWGDGAENGSQIPANTSYGSSGTILSHNYSEVGVYDVYIWSESNTDTTYGKMPAFYQGTNGNDMKIARIETPLQNVYNGSSKVESTTQYALSTAFRGCTSLEYVCPTLLENVHYYSNGNCIASGACYASMFRDCTSLTTAPELPATMLISGSTSDGCYQYMFRDCTSLTTAPELPATTLAQNCYNGMFQDCKSLTTAPELPATTLKNNCYNNMFKDCTSLTAAPELPATTLASDCYDNMFYGCRNLQSVTTYATNWNTSSASNWLSGAGTSATNPTIYCPANSTIKNYTGSDSGIPAGWTQVDLTE